MKPRADSESVMKDRRTASDVSRQKDKQEHVTTIILQHVLYSVGVPIAVIGQVTGVSYRTVSYLGQGRKREFLVDLIQSELVRTLPQSQWTPDVLLETKLKTLLSEGFLSQQVLTSIGSECRRRLKSQRLGRDKTELAATVAAITALQLPADPAPHYIWRWRHDTGLCREASSGVQTAGVFHD